MSRTLHPSARPVTLKIMGNEDEDDRTVEVEAKEIDGKIYLVGISTREVFNWEKDLIR